MKTSTSINGTQIFVGVISLAVVSAVIGGLMVAGSPQAERDRKADGQRLSDLQQISYAMDAYWNAENMLPASLEDLGRNPNVYIQNIRDPETATPYEYRATSDKAYELCTTFNTPSGSGPDKPVIPPANTFWEHNVGHTCFSLQVHPNPNAQLAPKPAPTLVP